MSPRWSLLLATALALVVACGTPEENDPADATVPEFPEGGQADPDVSSEETLEPDEVEVDNAGQPDQLPPGANEGVVEIQPNLRALRTELEEAVPELDGDEIHAARLEEGVLRLETIWNQDEHLELANDVCAAALEVNLEAPELHPEGVDTVEIQSEEREALANC